MRVSVRRTDRSSESGVVLVLVAMAVVFIGVFAMLGLGVFETRDFHDSERITRERVDDLMNHLSSFAQQYGRIPCPANPALDPNLAGFGKEDRPAAGALCSNNEGIFPFRALGLSYRDGQDGWGNYFVYRVSPVFTNLDGINDTGENIFNACRQASVWVGTDDEDIPAGGTESSERNYHPRKAKFCCPGNAAPFEGHLTDIRIYTDAVGGTPVPDDPGVRSDSGSGVYGDINDGTPPGVPAADTSSAFAFVILSMGPDGVVNNPENADGDRDFVNPTRVVAEGSPNYHDDLLFYKTQIQLYARLNNASCFVPFR